MDAIIRLTRVMPQSKSGRASQAFCATVAAKFLVPVLLIMFPIIGWTQSAPVRVGNISINIPTPSGFARVTPAMSAELKSDKAFVPPSNEYLAEFIPERDVPNALNGKIASSNRHFTVEVSRRLANYQLTDGQFKQLQIMFRSKRNAKIQEVKRKLPKLFQGATEKLSDQLAKRIRLTSTAFVPLPVHAQGPNLIAASMYAKYSATNTSGTSRSSIVSATTTLVHVRGRLLYLYVYGDQDDLDWTRTRARQWAKAILSSNAQRNGESRSGVAPATHSLDGTGGVASKAISASLVGAIIALFGWGWYRRKRN